MVAIVTGYLGFHYFCEVSGDFPYSQELLPVFIGAVATVLVTALLLNQQTELELRKEGRVLLLDHKTAIYTALIEHVGEIFEKGRLNAELHADLRVLNHKLARLTYHMRRDLPGQIGGEDDAEVLAHILASNAGLESDNAPEPGG